MLDIKFIRNNMDTVREALVRRKSAVNLEIFTGLDEKRRTILAELEELRAQHNTRSKEIGAARREGKDATALMDAVNSAKDRIHELDDELVKVDDDLQDWLLSVPNIPDSGVPDGEDDSHNALLHTWGTKPVIQNPQEHWELGTALGGLDFECAAKLAGSRFAVYRGDFARLERALASFMLDIQTQEHGYTEILPPAINNAVSLTATGQLPKFAQDIFRLEETNYYLIPTAEVPLTNMHRDQTLAETDLPIKYTAFTPCFRSEAGSYGKDTKGLIRQHQFQKVELVRFERPEDSMSALEEMRQHAETILQRLNLHYRVVTLCTGDLGFCSTKTYDLEVWLPGQNTFREISSCSNCLDFQARRGGMRFKRKGAKKSELLHTLNGSGLAVGRSLVAVLENYQQPDGTITVPDVLVPYMGGKTVIKKQ